MKHEKLCRSSGNIKNTFRTPKSQKAENQIMNDWKKTDNNAKEL